MASKVCSEYKLDKRAWHSTQVIDDSLYLWSGDQPNFPKVHNNNEKKRLTSQVQVFNIISGKWDTKPTRGNPPLGVSGYSCATLNNKIYYFGGFCRHDICYHNSLNVLDTSSLTWTQISPTDDRRPVMKRGFGGMMLTEYEGVHRLVVIGGSGSPPSTQLPQTQYIQLPSGRIRTNEQNIYNMSTNKWIVLYISGQCMPPNSGFVMEMIHNTRGIIFGGRVEDGTTSNTVYIVDIINNTLHWQTITKPDPVIQWPEKRWGHAASVITVSISPVLMVIGGMDINEKTIKDCWILDVNEISWTKINLSHSVTEKYGHSLSIYMMGLQCLWLVIAGGVVNVDGVPVTDPNITMLIELHGSPHDGHWSVGFVLDSNELSSSNNYQQRILKQLTEVRRQWIEQRIKSSQDQDDLSNPYEKIQSLQHRIHELESECDRQQQELSSDNEAFKTSQRVSSGEQLDITSLDEVVDILEKNHFRRSDWQRLGLRLGLYHPTLECIDKKYREDPDLCLQECLACWLHGQDKVQKIGGHTWSSLALAVQKIGYHDIANKIKPGQYKLDRRAGHYTQVIGDSLYLWGGLQPNFPRVHNNDEKKRLTSQIQIFNITSGKWDTKHTIGNPPLGLVRYSCTALKNKIYYFGGWCRHDNCFHNSLNELDISTLTWTQISPTDDVRPVMKRGYGGMMLTKYGGVYCLLVIGGQGSPPSTKLPQAQYIDFPDGRVRTNEQNLYNISTNEWTIPDISGQCMPPNNSFVMEMIHNTRAIIFGGFVEDSRSSNTVYIVDIINNTLHWQTISKPDPVVQWPEERYLHAASIITVSISPILVVIGGVDNDDKTLKDCWILDISKKSWTEINLPNSVTERWAHSLSTYMMGPHCVWLVTVGNGETYNDSYVTDPNITMLIELVLNDDQWSVGFVLDSNELTSTDNYQQRVLKQLTEVRRQWIEQQQTKSTQDNLSTKETVLQTNYQDDLLVAQQNIQSLQERLLELESQQDRQQVPTTSHLDLMHEKDSYIAQLTRKLQTVTKEKEEIITTLQIQLKEYKQQKLPMAPKMTTDVISYLPKLAVVLQPVQEDWELLGHQLNIDQSVLTDIRSKRDSTEQMKYLLEEWSKKGGTLTQLQEALLHIGKKDVISGLVALQDKEHMYTDISVQISTDYSDKCIQCDYWNNTDVSNLFKGMVTVGKKLCLYNAHTNHELLVEQCGLRLVIPAEVITPVESIYEVAAQGLWGGTFVFPKGSTLISGVCHISVSSPFELTKPVTVELMHCAQILDERQSQCLSFVVAKSGPPFKFEYLPGGSFSTESQYGTISLKKFSLIAIVIVAATELRGIAAAGAAVGGAVMSAAFLGTSGIVAGSVIGFVAARYFVRGNDVKCPNCYYRAYVFYKCISPKKWTMNFVVSQDSHYSKFVLDLVSYKFGIEHSNFRFRFAIYNSCVEEETLVPQVPINQETTIRLSEFPTNDVMINGWKVQPLQTPTVVNKTDVDDFTNSWSTDPPCVPVLVLADPDCIGFKNHLQHSLTIEGIEVTASKCQTQATDVSQCTVVIDISLDDYTHSIAYMHTEDPRRSLQLVTDDILNSEIARQTLVQCTYIIVESCIDPFVLARRVYSKEIISEDVYMRVKDKQTRDTNEERLETILDCLKNRVKYNADILKKFLVILRYISQNELADNITAKYNELATSSTQM